MTQQQSSANPVGEAELRTGFSNFPQSVALIAAEIDGQPQCLVASSFTVGVSLDPPLVSVAVQNTSSTWPKLREAASLGVSLLGSTHHHISHQLSSKDREQRFNGVDYSVDAQGALHLDGTPSWITTRIYDELPAGDHVIVLLEVLAIGSSSDSDAMVLHQRAFHKLTALDYTI